MVTSSTLYLSLPVILQAASLVAALAYQNHKLIGTRALAAAMQLELFGV